MTPTTETREATGAAIATQAGQWTPEEIAARKALWTAVAARLAATLPTGTYEEMMAYQAAVEAEVGCTYAELQQAVSGQAGPLPAYTQAAAKVAREMVTYGHFDGPSAEGGDVRGREPGVGLVSGPLTADTARMAA